MKLMQKTMLASLLLAGMMSSANAVAVTYDYVGNVFNRFAAIDPLTGNLGLSDTLPSNVGPRITGSATFADGIDNAVTNFILTDGKNTLDNSLAINNPSFYMSFINNNVDTWAIALTTFDSAKEIGMSLYTSSGNGLDQSVYYAYTNGQSVANDFADILDSPGTWTLRNEQVSEVPVPAALPLMASALGLFGFAKRRKQSV